MTDETTTPAAETTPTSLVTETKTEETTPAPASTPEEKAAAETKAAEEKAATDKKAADDKAAAEKGAEPITFDDVELPDTFNKEDPLANEFLELMNGDLTDKKTLTSKLADIQARAAEAQMKVWTDTNAAWRKEIEEDKDFGGDKLEPALGKVSALLTDFSAANGGEEVETSLREAFDVTGAGNHPAIVKFLIWTASQLGEGVPLSGSPASGEVTQAEKLFGKT